MKRYMRRILLGVACGVYLLVAPAVVLYSLGYRYGSSERMEEAVGVLLVDAKPRGSNVFVDDVYAGRSPQAIPNLEAGVVTLQVENEGYASWKKQVRILPGRASEFRGIRLFPASANKKTLQANVRAFSLSPSRLLIAVIDDRNQFTVTEKDGELVYPLTSLPSLPTQMLWSPNSSGLLLVYKNGTFAFIDVTLEGADPRPLDELSQGRSVVWDPRVPGRLFLVDRLGTLRTFDISSSKSSIIQTNVIVFAPSNRDLYVATKDSHSISVYNLQGQFKEIIDVQEPLDIERMLVTPSGRIALITSGGALKVIDNDRGIISLQESVLSAAWSPDGALLLFQPTRNELYLFNAGSDRLEFAPLGESHILTRLSRPITYPQWYAGGQHIIYQINDEIVITEIDTRDVPLSYTVDTTNTGDASVAVGADGDEIYYFKNQGDSLDLVVSHMIAAD